MIQVVTRNLWKILWKSKLICEELLTVICDIESVVNSRLLYYVYDVNIDEVITSSHLLLRRGVLTKFNSDFNENKRLWPFI